jgi:hypothetical protein
MDLNGYFLGKSQTGREEANREQGSVLLVTQNEWGNRVKEVPRK